MPLKKICAVQRRESESAVVAKRGEWVRKSYLKDRL